MACLVILPGCTASRFGPVPTALVDGPLTRQVDLATHLEGRSDIRIVLVGDTGERSEERDQILEAIRQDEKDLVVVLGDLVYPRGPRCSSGSLDVHARQILDERVGEPLGDLGAPVLLALGNHDVVRSRLLGIWRALDASMEACYLRYGAQKQGDGIHFPSRHYAFQAGPAAIAIVTSTGSYLDADAASLTRGIFGRDSTDWNLLLAHDVYRTFHDKETEVHLREWVAEHSLDPDIVGSGHAHLLQAGIYDGVLAITSGGGSKRRSQPDCRRGSPATRSCGPGQLFGSRRGYGYASLHLTEADALITFKDRFGEPIWSCRVRQRGQCDLEPTN